MGDYYTANDVQQIIMCLDIMFLTARILFSYPNKSLYGVPCVKLFFKKVYCFLGIFKMKIFWYKKLEFLFIK